MFIATFVNAVPLWRSSRFTLAVMAFLAFLNFYSLRVNISFAIVCMVNDTAVSLLSVDNTNETASQKAMLNITYMSLLDGRNSSELGSYGFESSINSSYDMRQEGFVSPAMQSLWSDWAPPLESSRLRSICFAGIFGLAWFLLWCLLVFDSPAKHPRISRAERIYIETSLQGRISTSKQNGFMSSVPYVFFWLVISLSSWLADIVRTKRVLSTLLTRKVFNSIGQLLPAILLVGVSYAGREHSTLAMALLTVGIALTGFQYGGGLFLSPGDIAPRYAGVVYGISNTAATLPGFLSPMAIGYLTVDQTQEQWRVVFFISAAIYVFGSAFFNVFASASLQPWAHSKFDDVTITAGDADVLTTTQERPLDDADGTNGSSDH
ncbi:hypothetical protein RRG08_002231 [Elysia crispata]|uniref:Sialin n=1 Tax=Elysia crispata TaxID=231223 RepID=A0AAE1DE22_9GAST|nr:hypothetical protein RRG08_002231 [Elysia crispata]